MDNMEIPIKFPVTVDKEGAMFDADGKVVANFCWLLDVAHVRKQMIKAKFIQDILNKMFYAPEPSENGNGHGDLETSAAVTAASATTMGDFKRRGNPNFQKGKPSPYTKRKDSES